MVRDGRNNRKYIMKFIDELSQVIKDMDDLEIKLYNKLIEDAELKLGGYNEIY